MTFIKGHKPTMETILKLKNSLKGHIPWNKGKKGAQVAWNKGKKNTNVSPLKGRTKKDYPKLSNSGAKKGNIISLETRVKLSNAHKGEKSYLWKGGITQKHTAIRHSLEYRLWRESVFKRDNWTCIWCGARCCKGKKVVLHADHIKPFAYFPELRFAIDNGRTLCVDCHRKTDTWGNSFKYK